MDINYFDIPRVSNSFLSKVDWCIRNNAPFDSLLSKEESTPSMNLGSLVHKSVEIGQLVEMTVVDESKIDLAPGEKKIMNNLTVENYCKNYSNKLVEKAVAGDFEAIEQIEEKLSKIRVIVQQWEEDIAGFVNPVNIETFNKVQGCYQALSNHTVMQMDFEHEVVVNWEHNGILCKSMIDLLNDEWLVDIKTYSGDIMRNVYAYNYVRQLSFYSEPEPRDNVAILAVDTDNFQTTLIPISKWDLSCGKTQGVFKLPWMYTNDFYMKPTAIQNLIELSFWDDYSDKIVNGWDNLIEHVKEHNLTTFIDGYSTSTEL